MSRTRVSQSVALLSLALALPASAGPTSHAMEVDGDGAVLFVDLQRGRLLRFHEGELSVASELTGVPAGDHLRNLVMSITGELYLGEKKTVWKIGEDGSVESTKPPAELKALFIKRPADLAPDGSVYVARDFKNIERSLPGGDAHPVLTTDIISKIYSMAVTPYGRVFFGNNTEVAKLTAEGEVEMVLEIKEGSVLGLAALGERAVLLLRRHEKDAVSLERIHINGNREVLLSVDQIASVTSGSPVKIATSEQVGQE